MREMQSSDGGYCSSLDADSEGEEGRFYVWQRDEVAQALDADQFAAFAARYGLDAAPNFEGRAWHLRIGLPLADVAERLGRPSAECEALIAAARARLFALRETRVRPGRDDKRLTAWNALAIDGMAFAARVLREPRWAESARRALDFVRAALWRDGRLLATHKDGRSHLNAYLDDHAFLLGALLELMQGDLLRAADLRWACALADALLEQFEDAQDGGFFFTRHDHESLVLRPKSGHDGALASGNGMAALHLQRLGHLIGEPRYLDAARRTMALFAPEVRRAALAFPSFVTALAELRSPPTLVMLTGPPAATAAWHAELAGATPGVWRCNCPTTPPACPRCWPSRWVPVRRPGSAAASSACRRWLTSSRCWRACREMKPMPENLDQIAARTLAHYDQRALAYWEGTRDHDVSQNIAALLQAISDASAVGDPGFRLRAGP